MKSRRPKDPSATDERDLSADVAPGTAGRPRVSEPFEDILARRLRARRSFLKALAGVSAAAPLFSVMPSLIYYRKAAAAGDFPESLTFQPIAGSSADEVLVPRGYKAQVLLRWGDSLHDDVPDLDPDDLKILLTDEGVRRQKKQFGYNCDLNAYFSLPRPNSSGQHHGLLVVNHEYTNAELMLPGWPGHTSRRRAKFVRDHPAAVGVMKAAHGVSVVEVAERDGRWRVEKGSRFSRRLTGESPIDIVGPAAGHSLLETYADPHARQVYGTLNNCAGGKTPWGTLLTCEENFDQYFGNFAGLLARAKSNRGRLLRKYVEFHRRIPLPMDLSAGAWELVDERFDVAKQPTEAFRFGWVVELDPYNPDAQPKKRTALGRFKHEGATTTVAPNGQVVVYSGDDARFEYVYKFVTNGRYNPENRAANMDLLDNGTLYAARFNEDGTGQWLPLVHGSAPLNAEHGFADQAEVLINARGAADVLGATPMDRPEDVETSPKTGKVYVSLTNNTLRKSNKRIAQGREVDTRADAMNPRAPNRSGHILELTEDDNDPTATRFRWDVFILCGDPRHGRLLTAMDEIPVGSSDTYFAGFTDADALSPLAAPDNVTFDHAGNLWITTDGARYAGIHANDGAYAVPTEGKSRGHVRRFLSGPRGCEICGPEFTPDGSTLFVSVQHPGEGGSLRKPFSDWPDRAGRPPRPSVVAIRKRNSGKIGT